MTLALILDRWTWNRKKAKWTNPHATCCPRATWLTHATQEPAHLMGHWPITQIPHIVDTNVFINSDRGSVNGQQPVILFLASAGIHDTRKGADLLIEALQNPAITQRLRVVIVGPRPTREEERHLTAKFKHDLVFYGEARSEQELVKLYSNADLTVVPSREDNMPIAAMESQSCGTPVVGFRIGGLPDIVEPGSAAIWLNRKTPKTLLKELCRY